MSVTTTVIHELEGGSVAASTLLSPFGVVTVVRLNSGDENSPRLHVHDAEVLREYARCFLNAASEHDRLTGAAVAGEPHRAMGQAESGAA